MKRITIFLLVAITNLCGAQTQVTDLPLITVNATAAIKVRPDYAVIVVRVEKEIPVSNINSVSDAFLFNKQETDLRFVGDDNLLHALTQIDQKKNGVVFVKHFIITVHDLAQLTKTFIELFKRNFSQVESVSYRVSKMEALRAQAQQKALQKAFEKARTYSDDIDQAIGTIYKIEELPTDQVNWYEKKDATDIDKQLNTLSDVYILNPGFITVVSSLKVSFNLQQ
jgi:uncharacterized protein YggE